jgi:hypothetical protein
VAHRLYPCILFVNLLLHEMLPAAGWQIVVCIFHLYSKLLFKHTQPVASGRLHWHLVMPWHGFSGRPKSCTQVSSLLV